MNYNKNSMLNTKDYELQKYAKLLGISVLLILLSRFIISIWLPYMDTTEARYGLISNLVQSKNSWIMPPFNYEGVPFMAKPPLSFWLSALSFKLFGVYEFVGRLPTLLVSLLTIFVIGRRALKMDFLQLSFFAFVLLTMPVFIMHTNIVSTDTVLNFAVALIMVSFWKAITATSKNSSWGYWFFVGLAIGLLNRGPLTIVFVGPPIFIWLFQQKKWGEVWSKIPWISGTMLMLVLSVPWYILAEIEAPGFIDYFIIGEHFRRYLDPGYTQDLYGNSHPHPLGTMWLYITEFMAPWVLYVYYKIFTERSNLFKDSWSMFLLFWLFWNPIFFSLSKNIMYTYMLSCTVPCALLVCYWMPFNTIKRWFKFMSIITVALVLLTTAFVVYFEDIKHRINSDKFLVEEYTNYTNLHPNEYTPYLVWGKTTFSSQFYTKGNAKSIQSVEELKSYLDKGDTFFIELNNGDIGAILKYLPKNEKLYSNYKHTVYIVNPNSLKD